MRSDAAGSRRVAVIGIGGRFPGAPAIDRYWQNLRSGVESIARFTEAEALASGVDPAALRFPHYVPARGVIEDADRFDASLFGFSAREAELLDPQHRVFLECAWTALEDACCDPTGYPGRIGVYAASRSSSYLLTNLAAHVETLFPERATLPLMVANDRDFLTSRVSYKLGLRGPSLTIQSACSSSLVAVHVAVQALLSGDCDIALAGGVAIRTPLRAGYVASASGLFSAEGHCRPFAADADGVIPGDGVGIVVLKRLEEALADNDHIEAVILGTAVNNDGADRLGYTAPSPAGQGAVITEALRRAAVDPRSVHYIETHGSGTALGDPVEVSALAQVYGETGAAPCALGSVKANIGHLDAAAGIASLIKTVLALRHGELPPQPNFSRPNPRLSLESTRLFVNTMPAPWPEQGRPRRAAVSSLGLGGTNAHVVLEEAPSAPARESHPDWQVLVCSAHSPRSLEAGVQRLGEFVREGGQDVSDVAYSLQVGRRALRHRRAVLCRPEDAADALVGRIPDRTWSGVVDPHASAVGFLLPGLGDHYAGMAADLYAGNVAYRQAYDRCRAIVQASHGLSLAPPRHAVPSADPTGRIDLRRMLRGPDEPRAPLTVTHATQFAVEYALACAWTHWGVRPAALLGYSLGEYVAACLGGVLTLEDALPLVVDRAEMLRLAPPGEMVAVACSAELVQRFLEPRAEIAAHDGDALTVVAGDTAAVAAVASRLADAGIASRPLRASYPFHTTLLRPLGDGFRRRVARCVLRPPEIPYVSNVTGSWITADEATAPEYWVEHLCRPVQFAAGVRTLREAATALLEVGPGRSLGALARQVLGHGDEVAIAASLAHDYEAQPGALTMLAAAAQLWVAGVEIEWAAVHDGPRRRVSLPTYVFDRERYWIEPAHTVAVRTAPAAAPMEEVQTSVPAWRQAAVFGSARETDGRWIVLEGRSAAAGPIAARAQAAGRVVERVRIDDRWGAADYERLLERVAAPGRTSPTLVHALALEENGCGESALAAFESLRQLGRAIGSVSRGEALRVVTLSQAGFDVLGTDRMVPEQAMLAGICRAIGKEYERTTCRQIDVSTADRWCGAVLDTLVSEIGRDTDETLAAVRESRVWLRTFVPAGGAAAADAHPRAGGTVLITGGLGGIGLALAAHVARTTATHLVLLSRTPLPPRPNWDDVLRDPGHPMAQRVARVASLEQTAASVLTAAVDVADAAGLARVLDRVQGTVGRITGVIHAAGVAGGGLLQGRATDTAAIVEPKRAGTRALARLLDTQALDFFVLCSSMSAIVGGFAHADYAAANAYLDAFSHWQHAHGSRGFTSINWPAWRGIGVASADRLPQSLPSRRAAEPDRSISEDEGGRLFERALAVHAPQVLVHRGDVETILREDRNWRPSLDALTSSAPPRDRAHRRPALRTAWAAPSSDLERQVLALWEETLGVSGLGVHDNFFELGGHSLLALRISAQLRERLAVDVPLPALLERPTVHHQVAEIARRQRAPAATPLPLQPQTGVSLEALVDHLEHTPDATV